ncbi:MAG: 3-deoxy-7-phosphoheptulonate synthase [Candidatus Ornithospirochaeta sp.]|nr:3-deoxy-7-phosphoheptulonate synthase [Candidatus Ornithospirochaeta sp.]
MIVILKQGISSHDKDNVKSFLKQKGFIVKEIVGKEDTILGAVGTVHIDPRAVELLPGVSSVVPISKPYKLASRELKKEDTIVSVKNIKIGGNRVCVIAGPCAVESYDQIMTIAEKVREAGAVILRGGAFKPRTSPYSFQGLGEEGLKLLRKAGDAFDMPIATEVVSPKDVEMMAGYVDMFQIGARNMQNFELLKEVGRMGMPVLLKRGISATIEEWLMAAEYLMSSGTDQIVLCERGIRTYEKATRNTLDCSAIPVVQKLTHLPIIGDPSHATGIRDMVPPMSLALIASGASGVVVEVHNTPECALSDGAQSLYPEQFEKLMRDIQALCPVVGKSLEKAPRIIPDSMSDEQARPEDPKDLVVAFQGERGAFSELAVRRSFDEDVKVLACHTFADTFDAVSSGKARYAVLPIENTLGGTIFDNLDLMAIHPELTVVGDQQIRIVHNLIGVPGASIEDIKKVYSHPQGLAQCRRFLTEELADAEQIPFFDTAGAVRYIKELGDRSVAAIAGAPAAKHYGMEIIRQGIETDASNYTRFYILSREENASLLRSQSRINKAAISFCVSDKPGALMNVLKILADNKLNMKKLESRPIMGKPWEYTFFVELQIDSRETFDSACVLLKEACSLFRVLGIFPSVL